MVWDFRPLKNEKYRVRLTIGGDRLEYIYDTSAPAANLVETKILLNSVISDVKNGARFMTIDIKDFFLQSTLNEKEYMKIHSKYFPEKFIQLYNLQNNINEDGYIYCEIKKGMYGLKQAAILAYKQLVKNLANEGYYPDVNTTGIWKHNKRKTKLASFEYKGKEGWYVGLTREHYCCIKCYIPHSHSEIIADTVEFVPEKIPFPTVTTDFLLQQTTTDLVALLTKRKGIGLPQVEIGDKTSNALVRIAETLKRTVLIPKLPVKTLLEAKGNLASSKRIGGSNLQRVQSKLTEENT